MEMIEDYASEHPTILYCVKRAAAVSQYRSQIQWWFQQNGSKKTLKEGFRVNGYTKRLCHMNIQVPSIPSQVSNCCQQKLLQWLTQQHLTVL